MKLKCSREQEIIHVILNCCEIKMLKLSPKNIRIRMRKRILLRQRKRERVDMTKGQEKVYFEEEGERGRKLKNFKLE